MNADAANVLLAALFEVSTDPRQPHQFGDGLRIKAGDVGGDGTVFRPTLHLSISRRDYEGITVIIAYSTHSVAKPTMLIIFPRPRRDALATPLDPPPPAPEQEALPLAGAG